MKKRDLLLAGLFLFNVSVFAQEPERLPSDPKVIFLQDFESEAQWKEIQLNEDPNRPTTLYTWDDVPVDTITELVYYKKKGDGDVTVSDPGTFYSSKDYEIAGVRTDSVIYMYNGIVRTDAVQPDDRVLSADHHDIVKHDAASLQGIDRFGEAKNAGQQYFTYKTGASKNASTEESVANRTADDGGYVPEYRRNLFVRRLPIEDNSSYRLTVFVKPETYSKGTTVPRIGVDLMRGYFHSEKSFIVSLTPVEKKEWWGTSKSFPTFSDKTNYTELEDGLWNKITLMAYYSNDSVGNASPYLLGYYWDEDWHWNTIVDKTTGVVDPLGGDTVVLKYIQQPAKYFARLSFRSDSTQFDVDNLSLTKSWIGGVEYTGTLLRVDFGYQTNLNKLAQAAKDSNQIAAVKIPGENFEVWAKWPAAPEIGYNEPFWEDVPILSAEYQGDGYMYMWTEPWEDGEPRNIENALEVLVSFKNPEEEGLRLFYEGNYYPNGLDTAWINNGKPVFDFHNEIASLNPKIDHYRKDYENGGPVRSLEQRPPVFQPQRAQYENGAFGLDGTIRELKFKFSKNLAYDGAKNTSKTKVMLKQGNYVENWIVKEYDNELGFTTIVRPDTCTKDLSGDYVLQFRQVTHLDSPVLGNTEDYGAAVDLNYHFGDFKTNPKSELVLNSNWRNDVNADYKEASNKRPIPTSVYLHTGADAFQKGQGKENNNKCGFYNGPRDSITVLGTKIPDDGMFYLSNRNTNITGNLYSIVSLNKGNYVINFKFGGHSTTDRPMALKFYAKPEGELADGNDKGFAVLEGVQNKTVLEAGRKPAVNQGGSYSTTTAWKDGIETLSYSFTVPADGEYVFEWVATGASNYEGFCISNYWITTGGDLSYTSVKAVNDAIAFATEKKDSADAAPEKYYGADYNTLVGVLNAAAEFIPTKKASMKNLPSEYATEAKAIKDAADKFQLHIDTVKDFYKAIAEVESKLAEYADGAKYAKYAGLEVVTTLSNLKASYSTYDCTSKNPGEIAAAAKILRDAIKAVEARQKLNDNLNEALSAAQTTADNPKAGKYATELDDLTDVIGTATDFVNDKKDISESDAEITNLTNALTAAKNALEIKLNAAETLSTRDRALYSLATALGATYVDEATAKDVADRIAALDFDDEGLAKVMMAAVKVAMYKKVAEGDTASVENLDLTSFIRNYHLYATVLGPIVDNTDLELPNSRNDAKCKAENNPGSSFMHIKHQWGQDALGKTIWVLMYGKAFDDVYPGWTVESFITDNHSMVSPDDATDKYSNLSKGVPVFDGKVTLDWNSKAELKQSVEGLPAGIYTLGVNITSLDASSSKPTSLTAASGDTTVVFKKDADGAVTAKCENILVNDGKLDIDFILASDNGGSQADNFTLTYVGVDKSFDYAAAVAQAQEELNNVITVVDFAEVAGAAEYEYYTLNWIKVEAPEKGQVYFRKSGNVVEKIIFK